MKRFWLENLFFTAAFADVNFSYCESKDIIKNISCEFEANKFNVLVGESGCGKSTLLSLLFRLWDKQSGSIKINSNQIEKYTLTYLRKKITIVSQEMYLFDDTIMNNIVLDSKKDLDEIKNAVQIACIERFINSLPNGYNTIIGEKGIRLSGGEKQRICLARAIVRDTPILILDEATSALDQITEKKVLNNLCNILKDKIIVIITHRIQAIIDADCIYVVKNGVIIEKGTHEELMNSNVYYKNLYERKIEC